MHLRRPTTGLAEVVTQVCPIASCRTPCTTTCSGHLADEPLVDRIAESVESLQQRIDPFPQFRSAQALAIENRSADHEVIVVCSLQENGLPGQRIDRHAMLPRSGTATRCHSSMRRLRMWLSK